ncbi:MAG: cohesin domain-containing protein [Patescibacteria group bacterium]
MTNKLNRFFGIFVFVLILAGSLLPVFAENNLVYRFSYDAKEVSSASPFTVKILVDSLQPVNGYAFSVIYDVQKTKLVGLVDAGSVVDFWRPKPEVFGGGRIRFEGVSIKPFSGSSGLIYSLTFEPLEEGEFKIFFEPKSSAYLANGKGTRVDPELRELKLVITSEVVLGSGQVGEKPKDATLPLIKIVSITPDSITDGQRLLSYLVKDDDSGVGTVTVRFRRWFGWGSSLLASNSMSIPRGVWAVEFLVADNSGNFARKVVYDWDVFMLSVLPIILLSFLILVVFINKIFKRKRV